MKPELVIDSTLNNGIISELVGRNKFGRYSEDADLPPEESRKQLSNHVRQHISRGDSHWISLRSRRRTLGLMLFRISEWDTTHFGFPFVIVESILLWDSDYKKRTALAAALLSRFNAWLKSHRVRFVSVRVSSLDLAVINSLEKYGFDYIESWIYNKFDLRKLNESKIPLCKLRLAHPSDEAAMLACCDGAYNTQRFHADGRFDSRKAEGLYRKWITSSFRDPGQKTLVHDIAGKPAAFMTYIHSDLRDFFGLRFAMWKMALIAPEFRGKGLGTRFFTSLLHRHRSEGLDVVDSGLSLRNTASLNLHNRCGFKTISTVVTLHKWLATF